MGRSQEPNGPIKQPAKKAQLTKLKEAEVGSKTITDFFERNSPKRGLGRPKKRASATTNRKRKRK